MIRSDSIGFTVPKAFDRLQSKYKQAKIVSNISQENKKALRLFKQKKPLIYTNFSYECISLYFLRNWYRKTFIMQETLWELIGKDLNHKLEKTHGYYCRYHRHLRSRLYHMSRGFIRTTDHQPTEYRPTDQLALTTYPPTHRPVTHRPTDWL